MPRRRLFGRWLLAAFAVFFAGPLAAQVKYPPAPAEYRIELRYRIRAQRNERVRQFQEMLNWFDAAGLIHAPVDSNDVADANAERFSGTIAANAVRQILAEPHVRTVLVRPAGVALPAESDARVMVRIDIASGLPEDRQHLLWRQTRERLDLLGYVDKVGYDHRGFTRLFGSVPMSALQNLLADLRFEPAGWFATDDDPNLFSEPIRSISPLRLIEVLKPEPIVADAPAPTVDPALAKLSPDLIALLADEAKAAAPTRLDVILFQEAAAGDPIWRTTLTSAAVLNFEGIAGNVVTVWANSASAAKQLAALPEVASVRLPRSAAAAVPSGGMIRPADALAALHLNQLHSMGGSGQGVRIAIVDSDFAGLNVFMRRSLPAKTRLVDLTAERNTDLLPEPLANDRPGRGTLAALAAAKAAPQAELLLVRVDASAPHQVLTVARAVAGEVFRTEAMRLRRAELLIMNDQLRQARIRVNSEQGQLAENFDADEKTQQQRLDLQKRLTEQDRQERELSARLARFAALELDLADLRGASVVACGLNWFDGLPMDGNGPLARYLDGPARLHERPRRLGAAAWLQAAGDNRNQAWAAPLWDVNGDGTVEFAQRTMPMPVDKWSRELNFFGWMPHDGAVVGDLPAGLKIRMALQWTEAHDSVIPSDQYRKPLSDLRLMLLRQRDPTGMEFESDDMIVVARSVALPQIIACAAGWATYEHTIEFEIAEPGRFAARLEGKAAASIKPRNYSDLPASREEGDVFPRLSVTAVDATSVEIGRPVFIDYLTVAGGVGTPADARSAEAVGAADAGGLAQPYSAQGSAPSVALIDRPSFLALDEFAFGNVTARGTATANGFAAGAIGAMLSAGGPATSDLRWLRIPAGGPLIVPDAWLQQLQNRTGLRERAASILSLEQAGTQRNR